MEDGRTYSLRILSKKGLFEVYVDGLYLQTFNNAHTPDSTASPFVALSAISQRSECHLFDIKIHRMNG